MNRKPFAIALTAILLPVLAVAQEEAEPGMSRDEVLAAHYEVIGGLEAWADVQSIRFSGTMTMGPGMEAPTVMTLQRPNNVRLEFKFQGMTGIQAYDGETAWMVMPFGGNPNPEKMSADQSKNLVEQADLDGPLVNWEEKGHQVELLGEEEVEGTPAYKLQVTLDTGEVRTHFLDKEAFVTIRTEGKTTMQGREIEFETTVGNYEMVDIDDERAIAVPHSFESRPKDDDSVPAQVITIKQIEINPELDDDLFAMPEPEEEAAAE